MSRYISDFKRRRSEASDDIDAFWGSGRGIVAGVVFVVLAIGGIVLAIVH